MSKKNDFLKGAAILGLAGIVVKFLGMFFRIPLGNIIGDEGMSYYQSAYPIYNYLLVISTAGIPTAIAKIVSEKRAIGDYYGAKRVLRVSFILLAIIGACTSTIIIFGAPWLVRVVKNEPALRSVMAIGPALFFVSLMSVFRGYFQGTQNMAPYGISQVVEQFFRVIFGLGLAIFFLDRGVEFAAAGGTLGATIGAFFGFLVILFMYIRYSKKNPVVDSGNFEIEKSNEIIKRILKIAIPITLGASIMPIMSLIDLGIIMRRLIEIGFVEEANNLYGQLSGYANTIVNLPQVITAAVQISIVPAIAHLAIKNEQKELEKTMDTGVRLSLLLGLPCGIGVVTLAKEIMLLLYPLQPETALGAGAILQFSGFGIIFLSIFQITTGIIQGLGKPILPARNLGLSAIVKVVLNYTLVGIPSLNIRGAAIATVCAFAIAAILNIITLMKLSAYKPNFKHVVIKPVVSVIVMAILVKGAYMVSSVVFGNSISTLVGVFVGIVGYLLMIILTGALNDEDLSFIPGGKYLGRIKRKIVRK